MATKLFKNNWSNYFGKTNAAYLVNGKTAIEKALKQLGSYCVAMPTYTCHRVYDATLNTNCKPRIVDCSHDLQIDEKLVENFKDVDTVIVPHMFGIQAQNQIKYLKEKGYMIIEDCSQCLGLEGLGKYSDIVIASLGPTKWLPSGVDKEKGGAVIAYDGNDIEWHDNPTAIHKTNVMFQDIDKIYNSRKERVDEIRNTGLRFIGDNQPNSWLRAMYFTQNQKRVPYTPLHDKYNGTICLGEDVDFDCPTVDSIKNNLEWVSVFPNV